MNGGGISYKNLNKNFKQTESFLFRRQYVEKFWKKTSGETYVSFEQFIVHFKITFPELQNYNQRNYINSFLYTFHLLGFTFDRNKRVIYASSINDQKQFIPQQQNTTTRKQKKRKYNSINVAKPSIEGGKSTSKQLKVAKCYSPQAKKAPINYESTKKLPNILEKMYGFFRSQTKTFANFLRMVYHHDKSNLKQELLSFIDELYDEKVEETVSNEIEQVVKDIKQHYIKVSPLVKLFVTDRVYETIRKLLFKDQNNNTLFVKDSNFVFPSLMGLTNLKKQKQYITEHNLSTISCNDKIRLTTYSKQQYLQNLCPPFVCIEGYHEKQPNKNFYKTSQLHKITTVKDHEPLLSIADPGIILCMRLHQLIKRNIFTPKQGITDIEIYTHGDGSKIKNGGATIAYTIGLVHKPTIFKDNLAIVMKPCAFMFSFCKESKINTQVLEYMRGKEIAKLIQRRFLIAENCYVQFIPRTHLGDNSHKQKVMNNAGSRSPHKCPLCTSCFHPSQKKNHFCPYKINEFMNNKLSFNYLENKFKEDSWKSHIIAPSTANFPLSKPQKLVLQNFINNSTLTSNKFNNFKFAFFHRTEILNKKLLTKFIVNNGGKVVAATKANFIFLTNETFKKKWKHQFKGQPVSIRLLFALLFNDNPNHQQFILTDNEFDKMCPCQIDKFVDGNEKLPAFLLGARDEIHNDTELFETIKKMEVEVDILHDLKGATAQILDLLLRHKFLHVDKFNSKLISKLKPINQMDGSHYRELVCGFDILIKPFLIHKKEEICRLFDVLSQIQFLSYSNFEVQSKWESRVRMIVLTYLFPILVKQCFGFTKISLYFHNIATHFSQSYNKLPLKVFSTDRCESLFAILNKINSNNQKEYIASNWINGSLTVQTKQELLPSSRSGQKFSFISNWTDNYVWKPIIICKDSQTDALITRLSNFGFVMERHYQVVENSFQFKVPPVLLK